MSADLIPGAGPEGAGAPVMTAAEFRILRDQLGVTTAWLAEQLGVAERTVRRWEAGTSEVPAAAAADLHAIAAATDEFVAAVVDELATAPPEDDGVRWVLAYASDAVYRAYHPDSPWSAGWHRAAMGRVAEQVTGVRIHYAGGGPGPAPAPAHDQAQGGLGS